MKIKKFLAVLVAVILCFSLATACVPSGSDSSSKSSQSQTSQNSENNSETTSNSVGLESASDSDDENSSTTSENTSNGDSTNDSDETSNGSSGSTSDSTEEDTPTTLFVVNDVNANANFLEFEDNKEEKTDKETEFFIRTNTLKVGDDNSFSFKPRVTFLEVDLATGEYEEVTVDEWNYVVTFYYYNDAWVKIEGADLTTFIENVDTVNCSVNFTEEAIGNKIKIEVYPDDLTETQLAEVENFTKTIEVEVIDGYNVYDAKELAYITKPNAHDSLADWQTFKTENGLTTNYYPNAVILQTNVSITNQDVPSTLFYQENEVNVTDGDYSRGVLGSLKDEQSVYFRDISAGDNFLLEGNYFTVDASTFPLIVRPRDGIVAEGTTFATHSQLFMFRGATLNDGYAKISNFNFVGNSPKVEDTTKTGGLMLTKTTDACTIAYNNISNGWNVNYFADRYCNDYQVNYCKCYDSFNSSMYVWGSENVKVDNCEMLESGGPAIIMDHTTPTEAESQASQVIITNSNIHSYVTGTEGWFHMYGATSVVGDIKALNALFTPFGKSFVTTKNEATYIDLVALIKSGSAEAMTTDVVSGYLSVNNPTVPLDFGTYVSPWDNVGTTTPLSMFLDVCAQNGAPAFATSEGGMAYATTTGLFDATNSQILDPTNSIYKGDYLYLYYSRMGICLGYEDLQA